MRLRGRGHVEEARGLLLSNEGHDYTCSEGSRVCGMKCERREGETWAAKQYQLCIGLKRLVSTAKLM